MNHLGLVQKIVFQWRVAAPAFVRLQVHVACPRCQLEVGKEGLGLCEEEPGLERLVW